MISAGDAQTSASGRLRESPLSSCRWPSLVPGTSSSAQGLVGVTRSVQEREEARTWIQIANPG